MTKSLSAVRVEGVSVRYGDKSVLDDVSFRIEEGSTYALLGRNGAGKSSLIRCLLGQRPVSDGTIRVLDRDPWKERTPLMDQVGYVPENPEAPPRMTVGQLVAFSRRVYSEWFHDETEQRLDRLSIPTNEPFGSLSRGQKTQVGLILALGSHPQLLILDDPSLGLDAVARKELFEELISEMSDYRPSILLASHDFRGIERLAEWVGIIHRRELVLEGEIDTLKQRFKRLLFARTADRPSLLEHLERLQPLSIKTNPWGTEAVVSVGGAHIEEMLGETPTERLSLKDIFVAVTGGGCQQCAD